MAFFSADLEFGNRIQRKVLEEVYKLPYREKDGCFKDYDAEVFRNGRIEYFEFKADRRTLQTGNLAIEMLCSGKPSGIWATKADFWIHCVVDGEDVLEVYELPVKTLSEMVTRQLYSSIRETDDGRTVMYLFPRGVFSSYSVWAKGATRPDER